MVDNLPRLHSITYRGIYGGAHTLYAWDGSGNLLEPVACQSDATHPTGLSHQFSKGNISVTLNLSWMPRVLEDLERLEEPLKLTVLGRKPPDTEGTPHPIPHMR